MAIGIAIGIPFGGNTIDPQAQNTYDYIIADGGIVPAGLKALSDMFKLVKAYRGINDITQAVKSWHHPHYGIKLAAGTGATAGGRACSKVYNLVAPANAASQSTPANQPLALVHTGTNYAWLPGNIDNSFTTPDTAINRIVGDIDIKVYINYKNNGTTQSIVAKSGATPNNTFEMFISATNTIGMQYNIGGYRQTISTDGIGSSYTGWVRLTRNATSGQFFFYTSSDLPTLNINSINWVQLGSAVAGTAGNTTVYNNPVSIGYSFTNQSARYNGLIYRVAVSNTIGGNPVIDFNPVNFNRSVSQTAIPSITGETWTINTDSATTGLKAAICDTTMVIGNGNSYGLQNAGLSVNEGAFTNHTVFTKYNNTAFAVFNELGSNSGSVAGFAKLINNIANTETVRTFGNVGLNGTVYNSNSTQMKITTHDYASGRTDPENIYYVNNSVPSVNSFDGTAENTGAMVASSYNLLARNNAASAWANGILACDMIVSGVDTPTQRTAMFNILKTQFNL